jgi:hypothetical protein
MFFAFTFSAILVLLKIYTLHNCTTVSIFSYKSDESGYDNVLCDFLNSSIIDIPY